MRHLTIAALLFLGLAPAVQADCAGVDLLADMPAAKRERIEAAADSVPFARGNLWQATRDGHSVTLVGTYHFDDPRHQETLDRLAPRLDAATALLVEAGPEEERQLKKAIGDDPSLMFITEGPTLLQRLPPDTWARLAGALEARGVPAVMGAKFQPWYASVVLAIPPCSITDAADPRGLDGLLIDAAKARDLPVAALEPWNTIFTIFGSFTPEEEQGMIDSALSVEAQSADFAVTMANSYFAGQSRMIWELTRFFTYDQPGQTPEKVDAELAVMEEALMARRNRAWIPVIEAAAARGPVVAAFGALHLSGEDGVLNLLAREGWQVEVLP